MRFIAVVSIFMHCLTMHLFRFIKCVLSVIACWWMLTSGVHAQSGSGWQSGQSIFNGSGYDLPQPPPAPESIPVPANPQPPATNSLDLPNDVPGQSEAMNLNELPSGWNVEIQLVLGQYSTSIKDGRSNDSIQHAVDSINGIMIPEAGEDGTLYEFSFSECLGISDVDSEDDGYDQVASTLYAALITAGLPKDRIVRFQHELPVDYIEIGLDSWVGGSAVDLRFTNPFDNPLTVFAVREGSVVTVAIAGNREDKDEKCVIRKEIVQELPPPVYYIENKDLKPGEKVVLDPGKSGVTVNVYRRSE
ncbi:MAG: VanW family protein, partial [Rhodopirellula sp. JB055]|uniref:VanW family protein n=1 Tax=Rhodopirellula sp. JB055 TaxID=3342846 RepID=UPI00370B9909